MEKVTVLMSTYNGEKFLVEQIDSILAQKNVEVQLIVRDDGSNDLTCEILRKYQSERKIIWYSGKNLKSANSFFDLIVNSPNSKYYALSDQDDVWNEDKLYNAVNMLKSIKENNIPKLYCSNYQLVNENLEELADNGHITTIGFKESIVSSCCTGCTIVFNDILKEILKMELPKFVLMHDDWIHKVCLATGGKVIYDNNKTIKYRQHGNNVDGGVHTIREKIFQIKKRIKTKECIRSKQLMELFRIYGQLMNVNDKKMLEYVIKYKEYNILKRMKLAFFSGIKTPYERLNRGFRVAIIFKYF